VVPRGEEDSNDVQSVKGSSGAWSARPIASWSCDEERSEELQAPGGVSRGWARRLVTGKIRRNSQRAEGG
jgi:hypothetical protein